MSPKNSSHSFKTEKKKASSGNRVLKFIGLGIVGLAVLGLIFSSVFSGRSGASNQLVFGTYGDRDIVYTYNNSFGQAVENAMSNYNTGADQDNQFYTFIRYMAWQEAFSSIVFNTAIAYHLDDSGYEPSSRAVDRRVIEFGRYRTNGEFDEAKYLAASPAVKESERELMKEQLTLSTWGQDVLDSQYHSLNQLDFLWDMRADENTYEYISIPFTEFPDENVIEYGRANSGLFTRLPVSRITVSDEETAEEVMSLYDERRKDMGAFADLAGEYSQDSYSEDGGSMGAADYYRITELMGTDNTDTVFALNEGGIAGPFDTDYGWMIFRVDGAAENTDPKDMIEEVRSYMLQNEVGIVEDVILAQVEKYRVKAIASDSFRSAMEEEGLVVNTTSSFPVNYASDSILGGSPENSGDPVLSGTASSDDFWNKIVPLTRTGAVSQPVVLNGSVALFSIVSSDEQEEIDYWDSLVDYEIARSRQNDFRAAVVNDESKLFEDKFSTAYNRIFPEQG